MWRHRYKSLHCWWYPCCFQKQHRSISITHISGARGMDFERQLLKNMCITPAFLCANIMCGLQHYIVTLRNRSIYMWWSNLGLHDCENAVQPNYHSLSSFFHQTALYFLKNCRGVRDQIVDGILQLFLSYEHVRFYPRHSLSPKHIYWVPLSPWCKTFATPSDHGD